MSPLAESLEKIKQSSYDNGEKVGYDNGVKVGYDNGSKESSRKTAELMINSGMEPERIAFFTGLSPEEISRIQDELK